MKCIKSAIEAYQQTNPAKNLYIDFIYAALLKMKEYNAHNHLEAYRKLMELFPIGIIDNIFHVKTVESLLTISILDFINQVLLDQIIYGDETLFIFPDSKHVQSLFSNKWNAMAWFWTKNLLFL